MNSATTRYCANCFAELRGDGPCFSCHWSQGADRPVNALKEFCLLGGGRYIIGRTLGIGGFGITYAALDTLSGESVAIKEYMPGSLAERQGLEVSARPGCESEFAEGYARFGKEWEILFSMANIKSIVRALAFFRENRTAYIVMERLTGADVKALLKETAPAEVPQFCTLVIRNIGAALIEVHNRGVVHLDVSPANIFFQSDGSLRLIDFGSAMYINDPVADTVQLKHGYAPPELYSFRAAKGPWTDVYALAATYYNLITGLKVPPAETRLVRDELKPLSSLGSGIPAYISESIQKALSLNTETRYKTVIEFLHDFENMPPLAPEPGASGAPSPPFATAARSPESRLETRERESWIDRAAGAINTFGKNVNSAMSKVQLTPPLQRAGRPQLTPAIVARSPSFGENRILISPDRAYCLGRAAGAGLSDFVVTDDMRVSKLHLKIRFDSQSSTFFVTDFSANGSYFMDGRRLEKGLEYEIPPNSVVYLVSTECEIRVVYSDYVYV